MTNFKREQVSGGFNDPVVIIDSEPEEQDTNVVAASASNSANYVDLTTPEPPEPVETALQKETDMRNVMGEPGSGAEHGGIAFREAPNSSQILSASKTGAVVQDGPSYVAPLPPTSIGKTSGDLTANIDNKLPKTCTSPNHQDHGCIEPDEPPAQSGTGEVDPVVRRAQNRRASSLPVFRETRTLDLNTPQTYPDNKTALRKDTELKKSHSKTVEADASVDRSAGHEMSGAEMGPRKSKDSTASENRTGDRTTTKPGQKQPILLKKSARSIYGHGSRESLSTSHHKARPDKSQHTTPLARQSAPMRTAPAQPTSATPQGLDVTKSPPKIGNPFSGGSAPRSRSKLGSLNFNVPNTPSISAKPISGRKPSNHRLLEPTEAVAGPSPTSQQWQTAYAEATHTQLSDHEDVQSERPARVKPGHGRNVPSQLLSLPGVEAILRKYVKEMRNDHEYLMKHLLPRTRRCYERGQADGRPQRKENLVSGKHFLPAELVQERSPFADMETIQVVSRSRGNGKSLGKLSQEVFLDRSNKGIKSVLNVPVTPYKSEVVDVPPYTDYLSLKNNVLAENDNKLLYWPYFDEDQNNDKSKEPLWVELNERFLIINEQKPRRILHVQQCTALRSYMDSFIDEIKCTWADVLRYLLIPDLKLKGKLNLPAETMQVWREREEYCQEDFNRNTRKWRTVLMRLPESSDTALVSAGLACAAFLEVCGFSLWHLAKQTEDTKVMWSDLPASALGPDEKDFEFRSRACRVCHIHDCPYHGELRERVDIPVTYDSEEDRLFGAESDEEKINNLKKHVVVQPREHGEAVIRAGTSQPRRSSNWWHSHSKTWILEKRQPFYPCSHEGSCEEAQCQCFIDKVQCEKTCACPPNCIRRFRGCTCAKRGKACWQSKNCECFKLNRECDSDLCATCGAAEVLDPVNRYNEEVVKKCCGNVSIQRNLPKRTLMGHSEVQGFGLFMGEAVKADEYLGEYKGELVTSNETARRGAIYQHLKTCYLFTLNSEQDVDSTRAGNKFRFINHSNEKHTLNCYPKTMLCNTVTRIGMFAKRDIKAGEELFFNYGYPPEQTKDFWEKGYTNSKSKGAGGKVVSVKSKRKLTRVKGSTGLAATLGENKPSETSSRDTSQSPFTAPGVALSSSRKGKEKASGSTGLKRKRLHSLPADTDEDSQSEYVQVEDKGLEIGDSQEEYQSEAGEEEIDEYEVPVSEEEEIDEYEVPVTEASESSYESVDE